jgi:hypothetical protein
MKIGEWEGIGRARAVVVAQVAALEAQELAAYVIPGENQRQRILVATDIGLFDFAWSSASPEPDAVWNLRGALTRWPAVRGMRLQTDAQFDPVYDKVQAIWLLVAEEPRLELSATTVPDPRAVEALLGFAHACLERIG